MSNVAVRNTEVKKGGVFCYDIEIYPNFFSAIFKNIRNAEDLYTFVVYNDLRDKKLSINQLPGLVRFIEEKVLTLIGYNNFDYDDLILKHILTNKEMFLKFTKTHEVVESCKSVNDRIINQQKGSKNKDKYLQGLKPTRKFGSIDLMAMFNTVDRTSLKQIAINMKWPNIIDLPYPVSHIVVKEEIPQILHYNLNDVNITEALLKLKEDDIKFRKQIGEKYSINVISSNDTNIAKAIIKKFYCEVTKTNFTDIKDKRTWYKYMDLGQCVSKKIRFCTQPYIKLHNIIRNTKLPFGPDALKEFQEGIIAKNTAKGNKTKKSELTKKLFEYIHTSKYLTHTIGLGGIHSNNPPEELNETEDYDYWDVDVRSFYPEILVNDHQFPAHLGPEFCKIYKEYILLARIKAKGLAQQGIDAKMNKLIEKTLKLALNSTFGLTKSIYSWLFDPKVTTFICISGQLYLLMLIERIEELTKCIVVFSNTDGITVRVPKTELSNFQRICRQWEEHTQFVLEHVKVKRFVLRDINNYLLIADNPDPEKRIKVKGWFNTEKVITKGYQYPILAKAVRAYYEFNTPIEKTVRSCNDIFDFMKSEKTSTEKYNIVFYPRDKNGDVHVRLQKNNRWIVTKGNPNEGRLFKYSKTRKNKKTGLPAKTNMQKDRLVTIVNDAEKLPSIDEMHIDYDFYVNECYKNIKAIKKTDRVTRNSQYKQLSLL